MLKKSKTLILYRLCLALTIVCHTFVPNYKKKMCDKNITVSWTLAVIRVQKLKNEIKSKIQ